MSFYFFSWSHILTLKLVVIIASTLLVGLITFNHLVVDFLIFDLAIIEEEHYLFWLESSLLLTILQLILHFQDKGFHGCCFIFLEQMSTFHALVVLPLLNTLQLMLVILSLKLILKNNVLRVLFLLICYQKWWF